MDPSPKSLILDLLSTVGRASAPVRALVEAGELFGIGQNRLRVALTRLRRDGLVESDARGRYRLGPAARGVSDEVRGWRRLEERLRPWDGAWVAVAPALLPKAIGASAGRNRDRALRLLGLRELAGLSLRPDNLVGGVDGVRTRLAALGLEAPGLVFRITELDAEAEASARGLWDADALVATYRDARATLDASAARLADLPRAQARAESFRIGGRILRQLVIDPLLPDEIVPAQERRALLEAMQRYDRLGREAWADWLGESAPPDAGMPFGVRQPSPAEADGQAAL